MACHVGRQQWIHAHPPAPATENSRDSDRDGDSVSWYCQSSLHPTTAGYFEDFVPQMEQRIVEQCLPYSLPNVRHWLLTS